MIRVTHHPNPRKATPMSEQTAEAPVKKTRKPTPKLEEVLGGIALEAEVITGEWKREVTRKAAPRDAYQIRLDRDGKKVYAEWVKKGRPAELDDCPKIGYRVNPDAVPALVAYLRRVVGPGGPIAGKFLSVRTEGQDDGRVLVKVIYKDKPAKETAAK
jgi:hypothetical protein